MIARIPQLAERKLQALCSEAGALSHKTEEDERGWDFLIEFPFKPFDGPTDMRPSPPVAYVQVKSTTGNSSACRIKLSNALHAAQSSQPWFLILFVFRSKKQTKIYAVHFWEALICQSLKEGRLAEIKKRPLNKTKITIRFLKEDDRTDNLVQWMQAEIDKVKPDYSQVKSRISRSAGFEDGTGTALMTIEAKSKQELAKNFLGLGEGVEVKSFVFTPSRFGISSPFPTFEGKDGIVYITPEPSGEVELRFRDLVTAETINLPATVYRGPEQSFRFSSACVEILVNLAGTPTCSAEISVSGKQELEVFEKFSTLRAWLQGGPVELQIWSEKGRVSIGSLRSEEPPGPEWKDMAIALRLLRSIASPADERKIQVELKTLFAASGLKTFLDISNAGSVRIEFEPAEDQPERYTSLLYWLRTNLDEHEFYSLVERSVLSDILIEDGKRRQVTAGAARVVERYVLSRSKEENRAQFEADFEKHLARLGEAGGVPFGIGDLLKFIESR